MRLKTLTLQNIRSYVEETIAFPQGSVLLAGDIGAGKSTILLAIEYALFGTKRGELDSSSLLRNGSHAGRIELVFEVNNVLVKITRILRRTANAIKQESGSIVINNTHIDATPIELRARVMELLGYPKESSLTRDLIYRYTVFTPQEQMRQIIYESKENRLSTLRKIFNIDKYQHIKENSQFVAKELRMKKKVLEESITDLSSLEQQHVSLLQQYQEHENTYVEQFLHLQQIQERIVSAKNLLAASELQLKQFLELRNQYTLHTAQVQNCQNTLANLQKKKQHLAAQMKELHQSAVPQKPVHSREAVEQEKELTEKTIHEMQHAHIMYTQQKQALEEKAMELSQAILLLSKRVSQKPEYEKKLEKLQKTVSAKQALQQSLEVLDRGLQACRQHKATAATKKTAAVEISEKIKNLDVCTLCLQHIDDEHKHSILLSQAAEQQTAETQFSLFAEQENALQQQYVETKKQLQIILDAEQSFAELRVLLSAIYEKETEKNQRHEEYMLVTKQLQELIMPDSALLTQKQTRIMELKQALQEIFLWEQAVMQQKAQEAMMKDKQQSLAETEKEIATLTGTVLQIQEQQRHIEHQLSSLQNIEMTVELKKQELQKYEKEEKQKEIVLAAIGKEKQYVAQQCESLFIDIEKRKNIKLRIEKMQTMERWFEDYFIPLVSTMEKHVFLQVHSSFAEVFSSWFTTLVGETMSARLDEDFSPVIEQNGYETELVDLSGGEKTAVALAYRLALNKVVNDFISTITTKNFIILDEPTEGFSTEQLDTVREVLHDLGLQQIILVSHEQKIETFVEHVIRIEKTGHVSKIVN
jgi:exonuclease SbcC